MTNCPSCGAPLQMNLATGFLVCAHCGTSMPPPTLVEPVVRTSEAEAECPVCAVPLSTGRLAGFELLSCARCGGMLIEMKQFVSVIQAVRATEPGFGPATAILPRTQQPDERRLSCPQCRQPMISHIYGGPGNVVIETCERCNVNWLDAGEVRRIARAG